MLIQRWIWNKLIGIHFYFVGHDNRLCIVKHLNLIKLNDAYINLVWMYSHRGWSAKHDPSLLFFSNIPINGILNQIFNLYINDMKILKTWCLKVPILYFKIPKIRTWINLISKEKMKWSSKYIRTSETPILIYYIRILGGKLLSFTIDDINYIYDGFIKIIKFVYSTFTMKCRSRNRLFRLSESCSNSFR